MVVNKSTRTKKGLKGKYVRVGDKLNDEDKCTVME